MNSGCGLICTLCTPRQRDILKLCASDGMLTHVGIMQILAHHPDFPEPDAVEAGPDAALGPFQRMLQFVLQLLLPAPDAASVPQGADLLENMF